MTGEIPPGDGTIRRMTVETTTTFTADEIVGVTLECPNCQTTHSEREEGRGAA